MNRMMTLLAVAAVVFFDTGAIFGASDTCFWQRPGVQYLVGGEEVDKSFNDTVACREIPRCFAYNDAVNDTCNDERTGSAVAFVTGRNELFVAVAGAALCPLCVGCRCYMTFTNPFSVPLAQETVAAVNSIEIVNVGGGYRDDSITVDIALANGSLTITIVRLILRHDGIRVIDFEVTSTTYVLEPSHDAAQEIVGISRTDECHKMAVFGTGGLLRVLEIGDSVQESRHDIGSGETVLCQGDGYIGTKRGTIFKIGEGSPVAETGKPLHTISSAGAGGDSGLVVEHSGAAWNTYDAGDVSVRHVDFRNTQNGRAAFIIDDVYATHQVVLYDSPTTLDITGSTDVANALNGEPFSYTGGAIMATFHPNDPEGNFEPITIRMHRNDTSWQLTDTPTYVTSGFSMVFSEYTVIFSGTKRWMYCDEETCHEEPGAPFSDTASWSIFDTVVVTAGNNRLRVANDLSIGVKQMMHSRNATADLSRRAGTIIAGIGKQSFTPGNHEGITIGIYSCLGRAIPINHQNQPLSHGVYLLRITDGTHTVSRTFHVLK